MTTLESETKLAESCVPLAACAMSEAAAETMSQTLKALADPLRLRLVSAIAASPSGECCVCDLTALTHVSQPTVSHHLKKLKDVGLLLSERRGTWVHYRIAPSQRAAVIALLNTLLDTSPRKVTS